VTGTPSQPDDRSDQPDSEEIDRAFAELVADFDVSPDAAQPPEPSEAPTSDDLATDDAGEFELVEDPDEGKPEAPPWPRLSLPALLGWLGIFLAIGVVVVAAVGIPLPVWAGWLAIVAFVGGFGLLLSRLPRRRPPGSGDGACL
jgi:hypothetical protein